MENFVNRLGRGVCNEFELNRCRCFGAFLINSKSFDIEEHIRFLGNGVLKFPHMEYDILFLHL